jgi:phosphatidylglycerophosphatase A
VRIRLVLLTVLGLGHLRPAPGTWGSLPAPIAVLLLVWAIGPHWSIDVSLVLGCVLFSVVCVRFGHLAEARWGAKDPGQVVADEMAGQCVALLLLPWRGMDQPDAWRWNLTIAAVAFLAFRAMDILKPPPANQLQSRPAGWGILLDDLAAGVYALIITQIVARGVMG